jgi:hypothetical protein
LCGYVKKKKNELPSRGTGAELRFRIWRGQIEEKKIGVAKTIKIPKFRGKIIYIYIYIYIFFFRNFFFGGGNSWPWGTFKGDSVASRQFFCG